MKSLEIQRLEWIITERNREIEQLQAVVRRQGAFLQKLKRELRDFLVNGD